MPHYVLKITNCLSFVMYRKHIRSQTDQTDRSDILKDKLTDRLAYRQTTKKICLFMSFLCFVDVLSIFCLCLVNVLSISCLCLFFVLCISCLWLVYVLYMCCQCVVNVVSMSCLCFVYALSLSCLCMSISLLCLVYVLSMSCLFLKLWNSTSTLNLVAP